MQRPIELLVSAVLVKADISDGGKTVAKVLLYYVIEQGGWEVFTAEGLQERCEANDYEIDLQPLDELVKGGYLLKGNHAYSFNDSFEGLFWP